MRSSGKISTGLLVFLCIMACLLFFVRKLQVQKQVRTFVNACQESDFVGAGRILDTIPASEDNFELLFWSGYLHYKGLGGQEKDREIALKLWSLAAAQGHKKATRALKTLQSGRVFEPFGQRARKRIISTDYDDGLEAFRQGNYKKAFNLWHPLAVNGHREAQSRLGVLYAEGKGVERDQEMAQYWWGVAAGTIDPHEIKDSFRTNQAFRPENRQPKEEPSDDQDEVLAVLDQAPEPEEASTEKTDTDDDYSNSGMKKTSAMGSLTSTKRQNKIKSSKYAPDADTEYKPWLSK